MLGHKNILMALILVCLLQVDYFDVFCVMILILSYVMYLVRFRVLSSRDQHNLSRTSLVLCASKLQFSRRLIGRFFADWLRNINRLLAGK